MGNQYSCAQQQIRSTGLVRVADRGADVDGRSCLLGTLRHAVQLY
jgi:hypothetical protein